MTAMLVKSIGQPVLVMTAAMLANLVLLLPAPASAREINLETLCQIFAQELDCGSESGSMGINDFINELNDNLNDNDVHDDVQADDVVISDPNQPNQINDVVTANDEQVIKLNLGSAGLENEWIRIDRSGNTVKLLHTRRVVSDFSRAARLLSFISPIPLPTFYDWNDHQTLRVAFVPDTCTGSTAVRQNCTIMGSDRLDLPEGTNLRAGRFWIEYAEGDLVRSMSFRVPAGSTTRVVAQASQSRSDAPPESPFTTPLDRTQSDHQGWPTESGAGVGSYDAVPPQNLQADRASGQNGQTYGQNGQIYGQTTEPIGQQTANDLQAAAEVVRAYYQAIDRRDYAQAYGYWWNDGGASGQTFAEFSQGFAETATVNVEVGEPSWLEDATGSGYVGVPAQIIATHTDGTQQRFQGVYVLRPAEARSTDAMTRDDRPSWYLYSAGIK